MKKTVISYLSCPECKGSLSSNIANLVEKEGEIFSGDMACNNCLSKYPIINYIPRFVEPENYSSSFGYQWNRFSGTQLDENLGVTLSEERFKIETRWPNELHGELILEVGSGMGRFTQCAAKTGAEIFSFDYSNAIDLTLKIIGIVKMFISFKLTYVSLHSNTSYLIKYFVLECYNTRLIQKHHLKVFLNYLNQKVI